MVQVVRHCARSRYRRHKARASHRAKGADVPTQSYRDDCLRQEIFYLLKDAQNVIGLWQNMYKRAQLHSSRSYRPPAPFSFLDLACWLSMAASMH